LEADYKKTEHPSSVKTLVVVRPSWHKRKSINKSAQHTHLHSAVLLS